MEQLWAPWRMPYIQQSEPEPGCLFCTKIHEDKDEENYIVYRGSLCFVMLNLYPYNSGHLMVVPYQHTGQLDEIQSNAGAEMFGTAQMSVQALNAVMHPNGFNLGVNQGKISGAGVADHIHLHVVPRWDGDTNFMPVLANVKVMPELLTTTADKLRPIFQQLARPR